MKVVLDTNVLVSALLKPNGAPAIVLNMIVAGTLRPLYDARIIQKYVDVPRRDKFGFGKPTCSLAHQFILSILHDRSLFSMKNDERTMRSDVFVGRTREIAAIRGAVADAAEGHRRIVALAGPPGIGKTRTVTEACARAEAEGISTHWVRCSSQAGVPPFWVWEQLIKSVAPSQVNECFDPIERLYENDSAGYTTGAAQRARFEVFDRVVDCVKAISGETALALVIDNLQWADQASLSLLEFLTRQTPDVHMVLIVTLRTTDLPPGHPASITFGEIVRESGAELLELSGLPVEEIRQFVRDSIGTEPTRELAEAIHTITDGNAFYVTETVRQLPREESPDVLLRKLRETGTPPSVLRAIATRLSHHSEEMVRLLSVAAQTGRSFSRKVLEAVHGLSDDRALEEVWGEATDAGIVERENNSDTYRFTHALLRDVLVSRFAPSNLPLLHRSIAEAKEKYWGNESEQHSLELADHYRHAFAGRLENSKELKRRHFTYASVAGRQALKTRDFRNAAELLEHALESSDEDMPTDERVEVLKALGIAESRLNMPEVIERVEQATNLLRNEGRFNEAARYVVSLPLATYLDDEKAHELVAMALETAESGTAEWALCSVYFYALQYSRSGNYGEFRTAAAKALAITDAVDPFGEDSLSIRSIVLLADACEIHHDLEAYRLALSACERTGNLAAEVLILVHGTWRSLHFPNSKEEASRAISAIDTHLTKAQLLGDYSLIAIAFNERSKLWIRKGDLAQVIHDRESAALFNPRVGVDGETLYMRMRFALERSTETEARDTLNEMMRRYTSDSIPHYGIDMAHAVAVWTEWTGDTSYIPFAQKLCAEAFSKREPMKVLQWRRLICFGYLIAVLGDGEMAEIVYREIRAILNDYPRTKYNRGFIIGQIAAAAGDVRTAVEIFEDDIDFCSAVGWDYFLCMSLYEYGALLADQDDAAQRSKAVSLLEEGLAIARKLDLRCSARRFEKILNRVKGDERTSNASGLSRRELEVLSHMVSGKRNKEISNDLFISEHTVENHVAHIFSKLSVNSRSAAVAYAMEHGLVSPNENKIE